MQVYSDLEDDPFLSEGVKESMDVWDADLSDDASLCDTTSFYTHTRTLKILFIAVCLVVTVALVGYAVTFGAINIGYLETYETMWNRITGNIVDERSDYIVIKLRLPRILGAVITGAALAVAGAVMQSTLKNPMADAYTTGVSSGASFGATLVMAGAGSLFVTTNNLVIGAFMFSLIPVFAMVLISKIKNASSITMIMAGIGLMYIFNALTTLLMMMVDPHQLANIYRWQVGTLDMVTWKSIPIMAVTTVIGIVIMMFLSGKLNILATGDESAKAMGIDADKMRISCLVIVGLVCAVVVSFTGLIGFVGLVSPHIVRLFIGSDNRFLIPACAALGSMMLVMADLLGRMVLAPAVVQVGVIMALVGSPVFLWLLMRRKSSMW